MPIQPLQPAAPAGYHSVTPYLIVNGTAAAIDFYHRAFGATEIMRLDGPGGKIWHAEVQIGNARVMLADECPELGFVSPQTLGGPGVNLLVYVHDVDTVFGQAIAAGAVQLRAVQDQFYGDRSGLLRDPYGHIWSIATQVENLSMEEICARSQEMLAKRNKNP